MLLLVNCQMLATRARPSKDVIVSDPVCRHIGATHTYIAARRWVFMITRMVPVGGKDVKRFPLTVLYSGVPMSGQGSFCDTLRLTLWRRIFSASTAFVVRLQSTSPSKPTHGSGTTTARPAPKRSTAKASVASMVPSQVPSPWMSTNGVGEGEAVGAHVEAETARPA